MNTAIPKSAQPDPVYVDGLRLWGDYRKCSHSDPDLCGVCDHDRYYARKYPQAPWALDEEMS